MIKLIATDVDGTLVKDGTLLIDPEYMTVVSRLVDQGIHFVVCSGRQFSSEQKLFAPIKDRLLYISDGGTVVRTPEKILKTYPMETALWKSMCRMVHDELPSCDCFAATPDYCLAEDAGSRMFHWLRDSYGFDVREVPDLAKVEMNAIQTSGNCIRNISADHFAGAAADEVTDPRPYAELLRQWSSFHPEFSALPRKFKIAVIASERDRAAMRLLSPGE